LVMVDYAGVRRAQAERRARGEIVGIGVAKYVEPSALGWESGQVRVEATGAVLAVTGSSGHGQGQETTLAETVGECVSRPRAPCSPSPYLAPMVRGTRRRSRRSSPTSSGCTPTW